MVICLTCTIHILAINQFHSIRRIVSASHSISLVPKVCGVSSFMRFLREMKTLIISFQNQFSFQDSSWELQESLTSYNKQYTFKGWHLKEYVYSCKKDFLLSRSSQWNCPWNILPSTEGQYVYLFDTSEILARDGSIFYAWIIEYTLQIWHWGMGKKISPNLQTSI